jgi:phosphatidylserine decarboxylase
MALFHHSAIAKEGSSFLLASIVVTVILQMIFGQVIWPLWLVVALLAWILRDPKRVVPGIPLGLVAPVDGKVLFSGEAKNPYLGGEAHKISIRMSRMGTYSLRSATEGTIMQHWMGETVPHGLGHEHAVWIQTDEEDDVVLALHRGRLMGRIACYLSTGERVGQGRRCGYIPLGTQLDIYLPVEAPLEITVGDKVRSGETILSHFVHKRSA